MKLFYLVFVTSLILDAIVVPVFGATPLFPSFLLASLPFIFLFSSRKVLFTTSFLSAVFLWIFGGINLGVAVLSLGIMIFFERWALVKFFQYETWQTLVFSAASPLLFGLVVILLNGLVLSNESFLTVSFIGSVATSALLAVGVNFILKREIKDREYEKEII